MRYWLPVLACAVAVGAGSADTVTLPVVADTNISEYPSERSFNYGAASHIRLKGIQMFGLFRFDLEPIRGWRVERASLFVRVTGEDHLLRTLGVYTVACDWDEGQSAGEEGTGATFLRASAPDRTWGPGPDFLSVSFTHGNTLADYADITRHPDGWIELLVAPRAVHAMLVGASYGLLITDEKGQTMANNDVYSREQAASKPYLIVEGSPAQAPVPPGVTDLRVLPDPDSATYDDGGARVEWTEGAGAFCYRVTVGGAELPRWLVPWPAGTGGEQSLPLRGVLRPGQDVTVTVTPVSATGQPGPVAEARGTASAARPRPAPLPDPPPVVVPVTRPTNSPSVSLAWCEDVLKVHPITGNVLEIAGPERYGAAAIADAQPNATGIALSSGRNEFVAATLVVTPTSAPAADLSVTATSLIGPGGSLPAPDLFRLWYVRDGEWMPEVCVPLSGPLSVPAADNGIAGQRNQSVLLDLYVPHDAAPGNYTGEVRVSAPGEEPAVMPVVLRVAPVALPDRLSFVLELNSYGDVSGQYGVDGTSAEYALIEREYHRLAHRHRANWDPLPYSQASNPTPGMVPPLTGAGAQTRVADWTAWDARYGPLLDGSAFADLPRSGVPVHSMYLPFCEGWPASISLYTAGVQTKEYPQLIVDHAMAAPPIEQAFPALYKGTFGAVLSDYRTHIEQRGWNQTWLQFYMNDKYYFKDPKQGGRGTSWWLLDEPMHRDDWLALRFYALMMRQATDASAVRFVSRGDISRPQWQPSWMGGAFDLECVAGELFEHHGLCMDLQREARAVGRPLTFWHYGTCNDVGRTDLECVAWALSAYLAGADGILPWNTIGSDSSFEQADATAILYPGRRFGIEGPVASLRLKAMRRGAQDCEYLNMLAAARGLDRADLRTVAAPMLGIEAQTVRQYAEDAGALRFVGQSATTFARLRESLRLALAGGR